MYDINAVIVNWKAKNDMEKCLDTLFNDIHGSGINLIVRVIDNSVNVDGVKEMLRKKFPQVIYHNPGGNIGFGKGQNLGFSFAEAKYYMPLNYDIVFKQGTNTIKFLYDYLEKNEKVGMVAPRLLNIDGSIQNSCCRFPGFFDQIARRLKLDEKINYFKKRVDHYLMREFDHMRTIKIDWMIGSMTLVRAEMAKQIGFYDERYFMYFEDCDWCRRAWQNDWEVIYYADVEVIHEHKRDSAEMNPFIAIFNNQIARWHIQSWLKYFIKWKFKNVHFGE